jgi:hypothetical protein
MDFARRIHDRGNAKGIARRREFLNPDTTHMTWHQQSGTAARNVLRGEWAAGVIAAPKGTQEDYTGQSLPILLRRRGGSFRTTHHHSAQ